MHMYVLSILSFKFRHSWTLHFRYYYSLNVYLCISIFVSIWSVKSKYWQTIIFHNHPEIIVRCRTFFSTIISLHKSHSKLLFIIYQTLFYCSRKQLIYLLVGNGWEWELPCQNLSWVLLIEYWVQWVTQSLTDSKNLKPMANQLQTNDSAKVQENRHE